MINVFKNRTRLYALTTSALFFLQGAGVSNAGWGSFTQVLTSYLGLSSDASTSQENGSGVGMPRVEAQRGDAPSEGLPSKSVSGEGERGNVESRTGKVPAGTSHVLKQEYKCDPKNYTSQDSVYCSDNKIHTMKMAIIEVKEFGDNAVFARGNAKLNSSHNKLLVSDDTVNEPADKGTTLELTDVSLRGKIPADISKVKMLGISGENVPNGSVPNGSVPSGSVPSGSVPSGVGPMVTTVDASVIEMPPDVTQMEVLSVSGAIGGVGWAVTTNEQGFGSGVLATMGANVILRDSNIRDFIVGLEATGGAHIKMVRGSIRGTNVGALADLNSSIYLLNTNIYVEGNKLPLNPVGLQSFGSSGIMMRGGSVTFEKGGIGVWVEDNGAVRLENVKIKIAEKRKNEKRINKRNAETQKDGRLTQELEPSSTIFLVRNGFVSVDNTNFDVSNAVALWVNEHPRASGYSGAVLDNNSLRSGTGTRSANIKAGAHIKSSKIKVDGMGAYGIYFQKTIDQLQDDATRVRRSVTSPESLRRTEKPLHLVLLDNSALRVPQGVAIYGEGLRGSVIVRDDSTLSGGLLLNAEAGSDLSVFVDDSVIMGPARIDKKSHANFVLSRTSEWYVTENLYKGLKSLGGSCVDSCISSMNLVNSSIRFVTSNSDNGTKYRTLLIGNERNRETPKGTVYNAYGNSNIYFNVNLAAKNAGNVQKSDRLLINGHVAGKTIVHVQSQGTVQIANNGSKTKPASFTLIQILGEATHESFALEGSYITLGGSPYKYVLSPYKYHFKDTIEDVSLKKAIGKQLFDENLLTDAKKGFWEFRLEEKREGAVVNSPSAPRMDSSSSSVGPKGSGSSETSIVLSGNGNESDDVGYDIVDSSTPAVPLDSSGIVTLPKASAPVTPSRDGSLLRSESVEESSGISSDDLSELGTSILPVQSSASAVNAETSAEVGEEQIGEREGSESVTLPVPTSSEGATSEVPVRSDTVVRSGSSEDPTFAPTVPPVLSSSSSVTELRKSEISGGIVHTFPFSSSISRDPAPLNSAASNDDNTISAAVELDISTLPKTSTLQNSVTLANVNTVTTSAVSNASLANANTVTASTVSAAANANTITVPDVPNALEKGIVVKEEKSVGRILASSGKAQTFEVSESTISSNPVSTKSQTPNVVSTGAFVNKVGQGNVSSQCDSGQGNGTGKQQIAYLCSDGKSHKMERVTLTASAQTQHPMHAKSQNTIVTLEAATIIGSAANVDITKTPLVSTVLAENGAEVVLDKKSTVKNSSIGLEAQKGGKVKMSGGIVNASYVGALAGSGSSVNLSNTKIHVTGDSAVAGLASQAGEIIMSSGSIAMTNGVAVRSESGGRIKLDNVDITAKKGQNKSGETFGRSVFLVTNNASVEFTNGNVTTDSTGLWIKGNGDVVEAGASRRKRSSDVRPSSNRANIEASIVKVEGDGSYGIYFDGTKQKGGQKQNQNKVSEKANVVKRDAASQQERIPLHLTGTISLKKTKFEVVNGIAIYGNSSNGQISLEKETVLAGDLLLSVENNSNILASLDNSVVVGGARVEKDSYARLDLTNKSSWILKRSARNIAELDSGCVDSCVSSVSLANSSLRFVTPKSEEKYQTLRIGEGSGIVYRAEGDASIHLNAHLSPNDPRDEQVTDRLVIHGDVFGKTIVHVKGVSEDIADKEHAKNPHSVSIIQVYGTAAKDSFQLDGKYVALQNSPYKYTLRSYSPEETARQDHVQQKFIKDDGKFWNFRLENQYVKPTVSMVGSALPEQFVRSVVPQVPTYLLLPNSVFHAGLIDINSQSKQLEILRATANGMGEVRENPALYLRGYGGSYHYTSNLSALEYGYKGDLNYNGVEAGILLQTIESTDNALSFGVLGSYGKLSLQPVDVEQSQESAFDKWTATAYGSMQHESGFYVDGLLSYGLLKGDVFTLARGKTATLKGHPLSVSLAGGQTIATGYEGFVVDPQVQVVYQHLQFEKARDIDNFDIEMGKLDQWIARVGGRLIKTPRGPEGANNISFYSKLYLVHGFEGKKSVQFKDAFQLGALGSSLEAGLGFNAKLSSAFSLHGDVSYQHKLNKAGFSGTSFSGGVRYQF
ncbi:autotransporter outer membrane beta-barrel domain-containing protein [Bartonella pachyuromydis]|uniref:Autotransporter domain-containing protein n=1 Tax=Bartonella pachyuromydis TaxID=931097 RepID=A0ABP8VK12_9HYPH